MTVSSRRVDTIESFIRMSTVLGLFIVILLTLLFSPFLTGAPIFRGIAFEAEILWSDWIIWFAISPLFLILAIGSSLLGPWTLKRRYDLIPLYERYPQIHSLVSTLCRARGLEKAPKQYFLDCEEPSPFIFGRTNNSAHLVITRGAIELLERDELEAAIQHELSHIQNNDMVFMTWGITFLKALKYWIIVLLITIVIHGIATPKPSLISWSTWLLGTIEWFIVGQLPIILILFVALPVLTIYSVSRVREYLADARATLFLKSPHHLNFALKKIMRWKVEKQIAEKLLIKIPSHLSILSFSSSRKLPPFIARNTIATHPSPKKRLNAIKTEKYVIKRDRLSFLDLETSLYTGLIVFYAFLAEDFFVQIIPVPGPILLFLPVFIAIFTNLYMIRYSDPRVLDALSYKEWASYILRFIARNLIACGSLLAFAILFMWLMNSMFAKEFIQLLVFLSEAVILLPTFLLFQVLLIKDALWRLKKRRTAQVYEVQ